MKTFIIAITHNEDSMKSARQAVDSAVHVGYRESIEIFPAITPQTGWKHILPFENTFDDYPKPENVGACFASHYLLWERCISLDEPILILEHDAIFRENIPNVDFDMCINFGRPSYIRPRHMVYEKPEDGAQPSVQKNFFESIKSRSNITRRKFYFTATPKHHTSQERGMNNEKVYGKVIAEVPAPELIEKGYIVPPQVKSVKYPVGFYESVEEIDRCMILDALKNEEHMDKVLVTAKSSKNIHRLITRTDFMAVCHSMKYNVMWITSKYGAIINGKKVTRKTFFNLMNKWGADPDKKFVMFHHSILSENEKEVMQRFEISPQGHIASKELYHYTAFWSTL